jgi:acyl-CoA thioesterase
MPARTRKPAAPKPPRPAGRADIPAPPPAFLRRFFARDTFAHGNGMRLVELRPGYARTTMEVGPAHWNGVDVVQGGAIFTLADLAFAAACNGAGPVALAVNVSISFLRAVERGTLTAEAREVSRTARLSTVEVTVRDGAGTAVALFHGTAYVTSTPLEEVAARPRRGGFRARPTTGPTARPTARPAKEARRGR